MFLNHQYTLHTLIEGMFGTAHLIPHLPFLFASAPLIMQIVRDLRQIIICTFRTFFTHCSHICHHASHQQLGDPYALCSNIQTTVRVLMPAVSVCVCICVCILYINKPLLQLCFGASWWLNDGILVEWIINNAVSCCVRFGMPMMPNLTCTQNFACIIKWIRCPILELPKIEEGGGGAGFLLLCSIT